MAGEGKTLVKFQIEKLDNNTFLATLVTQANSSHFQGGQAYDDEGALYYVVAVVFIYGFSIILMIGSLIKKNKGDNGVSKYMKDMDKVRRLERRQRKYQTRLAMSAAGGSRRASRALAARGGGLLPPGEMVPLSAPPGTLTDSNFNWDPNNGGDQNNGGDAALPTACSSSLVPSPPQQDPSNTPTNSPRVLLLGRPPPGRVVPVLLSPRHEAPKSPHIQPRDVAPTPDDVPDIVTEDGVTPLTSRVEVCTDVTVDAPQCSTVLYIDNEKDSKCKVAIVQAQLGTVHEVDEEHALGGDAPGLIFDV